MINVIYWRYMERERERERTIINHLSKGCKSIKRIYLNYVCVKYQEDVAKMKQKIMHRYKNSTRIFFLYAPVFNCYL